MDRHAQKCSGTHITHEAMPPTRLDCGIQEGSLEEKGKSPGKMQCEASVGGSVVQHRERCLHLTVGILGIGLTAFRSHCIYPSIYLSIILIVVNMYIHRFTLGSLKCI